MASVRMMSELQSRSRSSPESAVVIDELDEHKVGAATDTLSHLRMQAVELRGEIARLRQDLQHVQQDKQTPDGELREANKQLLFAALRAETTAENAIITLDEVTRSGQRDALTDIPNRALMLDRLESAIATARRHRTRIAVLFLDLNDFKAINDTLGHSVGDEVLKLVARRLQSIVRDSDTVSRYGGDEFLVLLPEVTQESDAAVVATKILAALAAPSQVGDHVLHLSASVGISIYPEDGADTQTLIKRADAAMYSSKRRARGGVETHPEDDRAPPAASSPQQLVPRCDSELAEQKRRIRDLREANEQLVLASLRIQQTESHAAQTQERQMQFLAMVAHELRNPLSPLREQSDMLGHARDDCALLSMIQPLIGRELAHISKLACSRVDGTRVIKRKLEIECKIVDITDILSVAVATCRPAIDARHQQFKMRLPGRRLMVHGDPARLVQIFSNLLDNAARYTQVGGKIALIVAQLDHSLQIAVSDNGIGVAGNLLPSLFGCPVKDTPVPQLHDSDGVRGLVLVRDLLEAHGGSVVCRSAGRNLGSEFIVTLPRVDG